MLNNNLFIFLCNLLLSLSFNSLNNQAMKPVKISSYQKMKQRYEATILALNNDITILVEDKDFMMVNAVKSKHRMKREQENAMWAGDSSMVNKITSTL